jgi:hypothetical protein
MENMKELLLTGAGSSGSIKAISSNRAAGLLRVVCALAKT